MNSNLKHVLLALTGALIVAVFAQVNIDLPGGIPISGQSFAVLLTAIILGRLWGTISILFYVLMGVSGLPVFADGASGIVVLTSGSGGFIIGFLFAAFVTGWLGDIEWKKSFWKSLFAMTIGTIIILVFGVGKLTYDYTFFQALEWGFHPFLWGAIIKIILGATVAYLIRNYEF
jgi:biotin transport system substrate-specific component